MIQFLERIDIEALINAVNETLYMTSISFVFSIFIGLFIGVLLYLTSSDGLYSNKIINKIMDMIINVLRAIPFAILIIILFDLATLLTGSMLGATAALPALIIAASPVYARMCVIAFIEVDKGTIEASKSMGASNFEIIFKVLIPEASVALVSSASVLAISLISYTAIAGVIGSGGLGNYAYLYGFSRGNNAVLYTSTFLIVVIVFVVQFVSDYVIKKIDKR